MSEQDDSRKQNKDNGADALSTDYAVALGYDHTRHAAPKVLAKGQGPIAQKIVQIAIDEGIEIRRDADLVQILKAVDIDEEIPVEAFAAVAEIISYVYQVNNKPVSYTHLRAHRYKKAVRIRRQRRKAQKLAVFSRIRRFQQALPQPLQINMFHLRIARRKGIDDIFVFIAKN